MSSSAGMPICKVVGMSYSHSIILQGTEKAESSAYSALANIARGDSFERAIFVSPFVTIEGVRRLNGIANDAEVSQVHWLVGLDGVITTPSALRAIARSELTASFKGWSQTGDLPALHAKTYLLFSSKPAKLSLYIGSANATGNGLLSNVEAGMLMILTGVDASKLGAQIFAWLDELYASPACDQLRDEDIKRYKARYRKPRFEMKRVARVVGVERQDTRPITPQPEFTWIELAVTGGSANQIEICRPMARFFTDGREMDRVEFDLVDARSHRTYSGNGYRLRPANAGHRVEVNTELARAFDLKSASQRGDIILFRKTSSPRRYIIEMHPVKARNTQRLIDQGQQEGRTHRTVAGPTGRLYYV
jgi:hypothetical protein